MCVCDYIYVSNCERTHVPVLFVCQYVVRERERGTCAVCVYMYMYIDLFLITVICLPFPVGWVLIDRSGKYFGTILNFLRDGSVSLPETKKECLELAAEAK